MPRKYKKVQELVPVNKQPIENGFSYCQIAEEYGLDAALLAGEVRKGQAGGNGGIDAAAIHAEFAFDKTRCHVDTAHCQHGTDMVAA